MVVPTTGNLLAARMYLILHQITAVMFRKILRHIQSFRSKIPAISPNFMPSCLNLRQNVFTSADSYIPAAMAGKSQRPTHVRTAAEAMWSYQIEFPAAASKALRSRSAALYALYGQKLCPVQTIIIVMHAHVIHKTSSVSYKIQNFWMEVLQSRFEVKIIFFNFSHADIHTTDSVSIVLATTVCMHYACTCSENIHANCMVIDFDVALKNVMPSINNHKEIAEVKRCGIHTPFLQN